MTKYHASDGHAAQGRAAQREGQPGRIDLLYHDRDIAVIVKPAGLLSVPYPGGPRRTAQSVLEELLRREGVRRVYAVHRLDRDTSGVMMFALNERCAKKIMSTWRTAVTERLYRAVAELPRGDRMPLAASGVIETPFAQNAYHRGYVPRGDAEGARERRGENPRRYSARRGESAERDDAAGTGRTRGGATHAGMAQTDAARMPGTEGGARDTSAAQTAVTHYRVVARGATHALLELSLNTGKKNQIRAQLAALRCPIAGDAAYRAKTDPFRRLALHARTLAFTHPATGEAMRFEEPEPPEWEEFVRDGR